jgi:predicted nucleotidyltransferase
MAAGTDKPSLVRFAERLQGEGVEFLVIGGQAAVLHGSPLPTLDVDLCYRRTAENLERLSKALQGLQPTLRGAPPDLPFRLDARSLALGSNFTFNTVEGPLVLLGWLEPLGDYEKLAPRAEKIDLGTLTVSVLSLDDLITIKRHLRRPKDQLMLLQLEALKRLRDAGHASPHLPAGPR